MPYAGFSVEFGERIVETVDLVERHGDQIDQGTPQTDLPPELIYVKLDEDLSAATDDATPATATATRYDPKSDGTFTSTGDEITITNRFTGYSASQNDLILVYRDHGEHFPLTSGGGSSGSCNCCEYVTTTDTTLSDGIETTRRRQLCQQMSPIIHNQTNGVLTITFPTPEEMVLTRPITTPATDEYSWDIPSTSFSAVDNDGNDVTDTLDTPSGSVIFRHSVSGSAYGCGCDVMELEIEWDADIPAAYGY